MNDAEKLALMQSIASVLACAGMGYLRICADALKTLTAIFTKPDLWKLGVQVDLAMKRLGLMSEIERSQATEAARETGLKLGIIRRDD